MDLKTKRKIFRRNNILDLVLFIALTVLTVFALRYVQGFNLINRLVLDDERVRRDAIREYELKDVETKKKHVKSLIKVLNDKGNPSSQHLAAYTLSKIGPMARIAIPDLVEALKSDNYDVRWNTLHALAHLGTVAKETAPHLYPFLEAKNKYERASAAIALVAMEEADSHLDAIVRELIPAVNYNDVFTRKRATTMLGNLGPTAKEAVPTLLEIARRPDQPHRQHALWALGRLGEKNKEIFAVLVSSLHDRDHNIWLNAMISIELLFPDAKHSVPIIKEHLAHINAYYNFNSALLYAAYEGDPIDAQVLIDLGANINIKGYYTSKTPLMIAAEQGHMDTVKVLLENGGDPSIISDGKGVDYNITEPFHSSGMGSLLKWLFFASTSQKQGVGNYDDKTVLDYVHESEVSDDRKQEIINLISVKY